MHVALETIWRELGTDPDVGAIVLTGAGTAFCAGGDIGSMDETQDASPLRMLRGPKYIVQGIANCEAPLIAAVNGAAAGLGATLALMCDVVFMSETARIGDNHVKIGMVAGDGGAVIWPLLVGPNKAKEFLLSGRWADAATAKEIWLVNHVAPPEKLMDEAMAFATEVANNPAPAVRWTKMAINKVLWQYVNLIIETSLATEGLSMLTDEHRKAVSTFMERREPNSRH